MIIHTRRSCPDDFRLAQSNGLRPGARATFPLFLDGFGGRFVVVGGTAREDVDAVDLELTPGVR